MFPSDAKTPTVQQWSLKVEQELTAKTVLTVSYVGSRGYHLVTSTSLNPNNFVICPASPCPASLPSGIKYFPAGGVRLNPALAGVTGYNANGFSTYNSLQIDVRQRLTQGLTFRANYSFSKSLDNAAPGGLSLYANCPATIQDALNPKSGYGPSCYDVTQRFSFDAGYDLPIGNGKAFLSGLRGAADKLLGGWKLNGIVAVQTGPPFTPNVGGPNNSRNGAGTGSTDLPSWNPNFSGPVILGNRTQWFNPNAFILPPIGTYENEGRDVLRGPGLANVDMSLFKETGLGEKVRLQFRAEIFNLFNHPNFGSPTAAVYTTTGAVSATAGVINTVLIPSREIQFGLKLIW